MWKERLQRLIELIRHRPRQAGALVIAIIAIIRYIRARRRQAFEDTAPPPPPDTDDLCLDSPLILPASRTAQTHAAAALPSGATTTPATGSASSLLHSHDSKRSNSQPHLSASAISLAGSDATPTDARAFGALNLSSLAAGLANSANTASSPLSAGGRRPGETADDEVRRRLRFLSQTKFIACLGERAFFQVFPHLIKFKLNPGELLFDVGTPSNRGMYVVSKGSLGIFTPGGHTPMSVYTVGESIVEFALIAAEGNEQKTGHRVSCSALTYSEVYLLTRPVFEKFAEQHPREMIAFLRTSIARQWRVASYVLEFFLQLPPSSREELQGDNAAAYVGLPYHDRRRKRKAERAELRRKRRAEAKAHSRQTSGASSLTASKIVTPKAADEDGEDDKQPPARKLTPKPTPPGRVASDASVTSSTAVSGTSRSGSGSVEADEDEDEDDDDGSAGGDGMGDEDEDDDAGGEDDDELQDASYDSAPSSSRHAAVPSAAAAAAMPDAKSDSTAFRFGAPAAATTEKPVAVKKRRLRWCGGAIVSLEAGESLFERGDPANSVYIVRTGRLCGFKAVGADASGESKPSTGASGMSAGATPPIGASASGSGEWQVTGEILEGCVVGGLSFFGGTDRGETVRATQYTTLIEFTRTRFEQLLHSDTPEVLIPLARAVGRQLSAVCRSFFECGLQSSWHRFGHVLYSSGDPAESLYVIISGRVRIFPAAPKPKPADLSASAAAPSGGGDTKKDAYGFPANPNQRAAIGVNPVKHHHQTHMFEVGRGDILGEAAVFSGEHHTEKRSLTAVCVRDTELVRISYGSFIHVLNRNPLSMLRFSSLMSRRVQQMLENKALSDERAIGSPAAIAGGQRSSASSNRSFPNLSTICLLPCGINHPNADFLSHFAKQLFISLSASHGPVLHLNSARIDEELGAGTARDLGQLLVRSRVSQWLTQQEENNRFLIFEADRGTDIQAITPWTKCCVRQSDCIILVTQSTASATVSSLERKLVWDRYRNATRYRPKPHPSGERSANPDIHSYGHSMSHSHVKGSVSAAVLGSTGIGGLRPTGAAAAVPAGSGAAAGSIEISLAGATAASSSPPISPAAAAAVTDDPNGGLTMNISRQIHLVILHDLLLPPPGSRAPPPAQPSPMHTSRWFATSGRGAGLKSHHHLRWSPTAQSSQPARHQAPGTTIPAPQQSDFGRFARFLAGESIGLVLSGGGARGLAHLGVLKALEEEQIPVDFIGGTSQGAMMAGLYALHLDWRKMEQPTKSFCEIFKPLRLVRGLTLPLLSYFSGWEFTEKLQEAFGHSRIEDCWIRYFCITTNMTTSDMNVHYKGMMWRLIRASMTVVGLLPPIVDSETGELLVDGGYLNNLPADIMAEHTSFVIASDVEDKDMSEFSGVHNFGGGLSGFWLLWERLTLSARKFPRFSAMMLWLNCINSSRHLRTVKDSLKLIDLYVRAPGIQHYHLLDYPKFDEIVEVGYRTAKEQIARWRQEQEALTAPPPPVATHSTGGTATNVQLNTSGSGPAIKNPNKLMPGSSSNAMARNVSMRMVRRASEVRLALDERARSGTGANPLVSASSFANLAHQLPSQ